MPDTTGADAMGGGGFGGGGGPAPGGGDSGDATGGINGWGGGRGRGGNIDANNNGMVDVSSSTGGTVSSGFGGTIDSGMSVNGFSSGSSILPAPVTTVPLLDVIAMHNLNTESISIAQDQAQTFNDSLAGKIAGLFGISQTASTVAPGNIDTNFSINPASLALGLVNPALGYAAKSTGLIDNLDFTVATLGSASAFSGQPTGLSAPDAGLFGGSGSDTFSSGLSGPYGGFGGSLNQSGITGLQGGSSGKNLQADQTVTGPIDAYPQIIAPGGRAAPAEAAPKSILPELVGFAALALELSG